MLQRAVDICKTLVDAGFEAYFAGGAVRDMLLGHDPIDIDIATSATPDEIEAVFEGGKFVPVGREFGVMIFFYEGHQFEIATFRSDSELSDGRRPHAVLFTHVEEDAKRRDFTINGMFYDPLTDRYLDYVGGKTDLRDGVLRFIGNPEQRIKEDYLRMLRAVRFKNRFGLCYGDGLVAAIQKYAFKVTDLSHERIRDELNKMLNSPHKEQCVRDLHELGLLAVILPEVAALEDIAAGHAVASDGESALDHVFHGLAACHLNEPLDLIWAILLHDTAKACTGIEHHDAMSFPSHASVGAHIAEDICRRLKFPIVMRNKIIWLVSHHMSANAIIDGPISTRRRFFMHDWFADLIELIRIDEASYEAYDLKYYHVLHDLYEGDKTILLPGLTPFLTGFDVMKELNIKAGPEVKHMLDLAWDAQLEEKVCSKEEALAFLKKYQE